MSKEKDVSKLMAHKQQTIAQIDNYIDSLINTSYEDESIQTASKKKADLLCYWLKDYVRFLKSEKSFAPQKCRRYKRGEIVKVHLGFRIGSEEGGLHYAVVIDTNNFLNSPTLTVVPLTSVKKGKDTDNLPAGNIYLGNELYNSLTNKLATLIKSTDKELSAYKAELTLFDQCSMPDIDCVFSKEKQDELEGHMNEIENKIKSLNKMKKEIFKMKQGSIALVNQVVTVSKLRIYDPITSHDVLAGIKLSDINLNKIDEALLCNYTKIELKSNKNE